MLTHFKNLKPGEFFIYKFNDEVSIYQKIIPQDHFNCVLLNSGQICYMYEENTHVTKVEIEMTYKE